VVLFDTPDDDSLTRGYMLMAEALYLIFIVAKIYYTFREKDINLSNRYVKVEIL
jgi:hypothetical protein